MGFFGESREERFARETQEANEAGQAAASNGEPYKPPYSTLTKAFASPETESGMDKVNEAYTGGFNNTKSQKTGGCFLTTACTQAAGLSDDCHELSVLRCFRDTYVRKLPEGESMIREYYEASPGIVPKLSREELDGIFVTVRLAVSRIAEGKFEEAFELYSAMFRTLRKKHLGAE